MQLFAPYFTLWIQFLNVTGNDKLEHPLINHFKNYSQTNPTSTVIAELNKARKSFLNPSSF